MKKVLRRVNRGLILAAVLLIGVIIYIAAEQAHFKASEDEIKEAAKAYLNEVKAVNLAPADERSQKAEALLERYWCSVDNNYIYGSTMEDMRDYMENSGQYESAKTELTGYNEVIRNIMAAQNGPGCVRVNVEYDVSMTMDQEDSQYQIYGLECDTYGYIGSINMQTEDPLVCSQNLMLTFYMYEQDGQWKIGCLDAESTPY